MIRRIVLVLSVAVSQITGISQAQFKEFKPLFVQPKSYSTRFTKKAPVIDGRIDDQEWELAEWSDQFVDIEGDLKPAPFLPTKVKMLWNDSCLFIAANIREPHIWANLTKHDAIVFHDNDFEVFIDPTGSTHKYYEIEVNALNTIFDLYLAKPYRNRGAASIGYEVAGLRSAVQVLGTVNNPNDIDSGWTVEMAIPFRGLTTGNGFKPPDEDAMWRINFSRVQWDTDIIEGRYVKRKNANGKNLPEHNWVWSAQGAINMHMPERWGYLEFKKIEKSTENLKLRYAEQQKRYLWLLYYKQKQFQNTNGHYAATLKALGFDHSEISINERPNYLQLKTTNGFFSATITGSSMSWSINEEGLVKKHAMQRLLY